MDPYRFERGKLVAAVLTGAWRLAAPPIAFSEDELERAWPPILQSASAGLSWWRIRNDDSKLSPTGIQMQNAFRHYAASAIAKSRSLKNLIGLFHSRNIEPILAKGWAIAQCYPHPAMRPYGDFDLLIDRGYKQKILALPEFQQGAFAADLHEGFRELEASYPELLERSRRIVINGDYVRVLSAEDHLKLLCLHALHHGVWRPLWLCDIALLAESCAPEFDWRHCLSGEKWRTEWVIAALALSHRILGARLPQEIRYVESMDLPSWTYNTVYEQWGRVGHYMQGAGASELLRGGKFVRALTSRWPNSIQATVRMKGRVRRGSRLPYKVADVIRRTATLLLNRQDSH